MLSVKGLGWPFANQIPVGAPLLWGNGHGSVQSRRSSSADIEEAKINPPASTHPSRARHGASAWFCCC